MRPHRPSSSGPVEVSGSGFTWFRVEGPRVQARVWGLRVKSWP